MSAGFLLVTEQRNLCEYLFQMCSVNVELLLIEFCVSTFINMQPLRAASWLVEPVLSGLGMFDKDMWTGLLQKDQF